MNNFRWEIDFIVLFFKSLCAIDNQQNPKIADVFVSYMLATLYCSYFEGSCQQLIMSHNIVMYQ